MLVSYKKIFEKMYELSQANGSKLHINLKPHWSALYERPDSMIKNNQWTLNVGGAATATGVHFSDFGITFTVRFNGTPFTFDLPWGSFVALEWAGICEGFGVEKVSTYLDMGIVLDQDVNIPRDAPVQLSVLKVDFTRDHAPVHRNILLVIPRTDDLEDLALLGGEHGYLKNFIKTEQERVVVTEPPKTKRPTLTVVK